MLGQQEYVALGSHGRLWLVGGVQLPDAGFRECSSRLSRFRFRSGRTYPDLRRFEWVVGGASASDSGGLMKRGLVNGSFSGSRDQPCTTTGLCQFNHRSAKRLGRNTPGMLFASVFGDKVASDTSNLKPNSMTMLPA